MRDVVEIAVSLGRITAYLEWYDRWEQKLPPERYFRVKAVAMAIDNRFTRLKEEHRSLLQRHWDHLNDLIKLHQPDSL